MKSHIVLACAAVTAAGLAVGVHGQAPPAPAATPATPPPAQAGRGQLAGPQPDFSPKPAVRGVSVEEQRQRFVLPPGYRIAAVLSDPIVEEPMQIAFDGNGRMFVLENRGYMQDADATGELDPVGRISVHEDVDNDGVYDKHTVFLEGLVFPRFVMPIGPGSHPRDGIEHRQHLQVHGHERRLEGRQEGTLRDELRQVGQRRAPAEQPVLGHGQLDVQHLQPVPDSLDTDRPGAAREGRLEQRAVGHHAGQLRQDATSRAAPAACPGTSSFRFTTATTTSPTGSSRAPTFPGALRALATTSQVSAPCGRSRPTRRSTASPGAAGNDVFRGDRLPADLVGDYLYGEPVARIVRRLRDVGTEGLPQLRQMYQWQYGEFIRSTDPLFRPVDLATAPDGTLYIVDTYRGIIQEGNWTRPGSYLRQKIDQYDLDKNIRKGRIWRLTYEGMDRDTTRPRMNDETPAQLVARLSHPNGWWRDTAQQLLVLKQDKSVVPALAADRTVVLESLRPVPCALDARRTGRARRGARPAIDAGSRAPKMRIQAIRASETLYKTGDAIARGRLPRGDGRRRQPTWSFRQCRRSGSSALRTWRPSWVAQAEESGAGREAHRRSDRHRAHGRWTRRARRGHGPPPNPEIVAVMERGEGIYKELCFSCHGAEGFGAEKEGGAPGAKMAPPLSGSPRVQGHRDYVITGAPPWADWAGRRSDLHRSHDSDGLEHRRVDRGYRVVRPEQFRQPGRDW